MPKTRREIAREVDEILRSEPPARVRSPAWVPASKAETRKIIKARRAEIPYGTLPVESAVELTRAYQGFKRGKPDINVARAGLESARKHRIKNLRYGLYRHAGDREFRWGNFTGTPEDVITAVPVNAKTVASQQALEHALNKARRA